MIDEKETPEKLTTEVVLCLEENKKQYAGHFRFNNFRKAPEIFYVIYHS